MLHKLPSRLSICEAQRRHQASWKYSAHPLLKRLKCYMRESHWAQVYVYVSPRGQDVCAMRAA